MRLPRALSAVLLALLLVAGCSEGRGLVITGDGRMVPNTAENHRGETERRIEEGIAAGLPPLWRCHARIAEDPEWIDSGVDDGAWRWRVLTATVELAGGDPAHPPESAPIRAEVQRFLARKVARAADLRIEVVVAAVPAPVSIATPAPASAAPSRRYVLRSGDTLGLLSSVYYGTPHEWRRILDANPDLDPANLTPGREITIP